MEATWGDGGGDAVEQGGQTAARSMDERGVGRFYFFYFFIFGCGQLDAQA
jgi:hypothetical protein